MNRHSITTYSVGGAYLALGLLLLGTLIGIFESSTVYSWVIPIVLIFSGITTLQAESKYKTTVSYGLIAIGVITIFVRLNVIRGDVVNGLLGAVLLIAGAAIIARGTSQQDQSAKD